MVQNWPWDCHIFLKKEQKKVRQHSPYKNKTSFRNINEQFLSLFKSENDCKEFHNCFQINVLAFPHQREISPATFIFV